MRVKHLQYHSFSSIVLLFLLMNCSSKSLHKESGVTDSNNKTFIYDSTDIGHFNLFPLPPEEDNNFFYTDFSFFRLSKVKDSSFYIDSDTNFKKSLFYDRINNEILQVAFYKKIIINSGYYKLDTTTYFCEVPLFLGSRKTDTIFLAKSFKGYRNDKWLYWDTTGNIIKEEIWESGVLEEDPDKK